MSCVSRLLLVLSCLAAAARGEITWNGDVDPEDPTTWTAFSNGYIGKMADGAISINGGSSLDLGYGYIGNYAGATGSAIVAGAGSQWNNTGDLRMGFFGSGTLQVTGGGVVSNQYGWVGDKPGSNGSATVTGPGSQWNTNRLLYVGRAGSGTLLVSAGGLVTNTSGYLGYGSGSTGTATVTGANSEWNNTGSLSVGREGSGSLLVAEGGVVTNTSGSLGYGSGSTGSATVTGAGSQWNNSDNLDVGREGSGSLLVTAGGQVSSASSILGDHEGVTGSVIVAGAGSEWNNSGRLYVGSDGSGTLTVEDGGQVTVGTLFASPDDLYGNGTIIATKGAVLDADLRFDASHGTHAAINFGSGGTLNVTGFGGHFGVGYKDRGSLTISEGIALSSEYGVLGVRSGSFGTATVSGAGSQWNNSNLSVGRGGRGKLRIEAGGQVHNDVGLVINASSVTVTGVGSHWENSGLLTVGWFGHGTLCVETGGLVSSADSLLGAGASAASVTVIGTNSQWNNGNRLSLGYGGRATLEITSGGLVVIGGELTIDLVEDNDSSLNMTTGGMLALFGEADDSIGQFLDLVQGTDAIHYWSTDLADWAPITDATYGDDYTLKYLTTGDLAGYTLLTVGSMPVPEPSSLVLLLVAGLAVVAKLRLSKNSY